MQCDERAYRATCWPSDGAGRVLAQARQPGGARYDDRADKAADACDDPDGEYVFPSILRGSAPTGDSRQGCNFSACAANRTGSSSPALRPVKLWHALLEAERRLLLSQHLRVANGCRDGICHGFNMPRRAVGGRTALRQGLAGGELRSPWKPEPCGRFALSSQRAWLHWIL